MFLTFFRLCTPKFFINQRSQSLKNTIFLQGKEKAQAILCGLTSILTQHYGKIVFLNHIGFDSLMSKERLLYKPYCSMNLILQFCRILRKISGAYNAPSELEAFDELRGRSLGVQSACLFFAKKSYCENCSLLKLALHFDIAAVSFNNRFCKRKPEPYARFVLRKSAPVKPLEYMR